MQVSVQHHPPRALPLTARGWVGTDPVWTYGVTSNVFI